MKRICRLTFTWFVFVYFYMIYQVYSRDNAVAFDWGFKNLSVVFWGVVFTYFATEALFFTFGKNRRVLQSVMAGLALTYAMLGYYHHRTVQVFDFAIIADHWKTVWAPGTFNESLSVVNSLFSFPHYFWSIVGAVVTWFAVGWDLKYRRPARAWSLAPALGMFVMAMVTIEAPVNEFTAFSKTVVLRLVSERSAFQMKYKPTSFAQYPLVRDFKAHHGGSAGAPNVFLVFVESFNAGFVETLADNGKVRTPYFNELLKQGLYFEHFYGQSIQTGRSHFASLCGVTPSMYGKDFVEFEDRNLNCLPKILQKNGYFTIFSKANSDVNFDNTYRFTTKNGYEVMNSMGRGCQNEPEGTCWGWGIRDDIFYQRFFSYLHDHAPKDRPLFATLATISSHMPFDEVPEKDRLMYPDPQNRLQHYSNALRITDEYLKTLISEFKKSPYAENSVMIILGDHSFPMGEHKNFFSENLAFEENFRIPMAILDFRKVPVVKPGRVHEAYSQLNLPATILDLAGISDSVQFVADSALQAPPEYIPMVQPYGGIYFSVVKYPYKYMLYERSGKESLFDLSKDPLESHNLITSIQDPTALEGFRREVGKVWFNYDLMKEDRIWPRQGRGLAGQAE